MQVSGHAALFCWHLWPVAVLAATVAQAAPSRVSDYVDAAPSCTASGPGAANLPWPSGRAAFQRGRCRGEAKTKEPRGAAAAATAAATAADVQATGRLPRLPRLPRLLPLAASAQQLNRTLVSRLSSWRAAPFPLSVLSARPRSARPRPGRRSGAALRRVRAGQGRTSLLCVQPSALVFGGSP